MEQLGILLSILGNLTLDKSPRFNRSEQLYQFTPFSSHSYNLTAMSPNYCCSSSADS